MRLCPTCKHLVPGYDAAHGLCQVKSSGTVKVYPSVAVQCEMFQRKRRRDGVHQ